MNALLIGKKVKGSLVGQDGNAFALLGYFQRQAKRSGWTNQEINEVVLEATSGDYDHLVATLDIFFEPKTEDDFLGESV